MTPGGRRPNQRHAPDPPSSAAPSATADAGGRRAPLDGLRTLAVYLVLLYHAGVDRLDGGFVGVDVFFVLSGYLVTGLLVGPGPVRSGSIGLVRFYSRRVRRLLPAASVVLVATAVIVAAVRPPATWTDASEAIRAASLYVSNWFFIARSADYFAADVATNPVLHFWSLSVEEQFYLVWPLLLVGALRIGTSWSDRTRRRALQGAVALGAAASLAWALHLSTTQLDRAYYGTDARAYQLLAGALLALAPGLRRRARRATDRSNGLAGAAQLGLLAATVAAASWLVDVGPVARGTATTVLAVALILLVEAAPQGLGARALGWRPVAYLGRISYGTYLWHWIIVVVLVTETDLGTRPIAAITVVGATALAALSSRLLEQPIRTSPALDRHRGPTIAAGLAISAAVGLVVAPLVFRLAPDDRGPTATDDGRAIDASSLDWRAAQRDEVRPPTCTATDLEPCLVVDGDGPTVLLVGDSHAAMFAPMLAEVAQERGWRLAVASVPTCTWPQGLFSPMTDDCQGAQADWYGPILDAFDPDLVVLSSRVLDDPSAPAVLFGDGTDFLRTGEPAYDRLVAERTEATVDLLRDQGRNVAVIEPIPQQADAQQDPVECLSEGGDARRCGFDAAADPGTQEVLLRSLDDGRGVWSLDLDPLVCPDLPRCEVVVDGLIVRRDRTHLTGTFARHLAPAFAELLDERGVAPA